MSEGPKKTKTENFATTLDNFATTHKHFDIKSINDVYPEKQDDIVTKNDGYNGIKRWHFFLMMK